MVAPARSHPAMLSTRPFLGEPPLPRNPKPLDSLQASCLNTESSCLQKIQQYPKSFLSVHYLPGSTWAPGVQRGVDRYGLSACSLLPGGKVCQPATPGKKCGGNTCPSCYSCPAQLPPSPARAPALPWSASLRTEGSLLPAQANQSSSLSFESQPLLVSTELHSITSTHT